MILFNDIVLMVCTSLSDTFLQLIVYRGFLENKTLNVIHENCVGFHCDNMYSRCLFINYMTYIDDIIIHVTYVYNYTYFFENYMLNSEYV